MLIYPVLPTYRLGTQQREMDTSHVREPRDLGQALLGKYFGRGIYCKIGRIEISVLVFFK